MTEDSEFLAMTADDASEFYRYLGRALWALGSFENYLVHYIVIVLRSSFDTMEAAQRELDRAFSFTLGNLLREFRRYRELAPDLDGRLDAFKAERDWLCHSIYARNHTDLLNRSRFVALLKRLDGFKREATELQAILDRNFDVWCEANGIMQAELQERMSRTIAEWQSD